LGGPKFKKGILRALWKKIGLTFPKKIGNPKETRRAFVVREEPKGKPLEKVYPNQSKPFPKKPKKVFQRE